MTCTKEMRKWFTHSHLVNTDDTAIGQHHRSTLKVKLSFRILVH